MRWIEYSKQTPPPRFCHKVVCKKEGSIFLRAYNIIQMPWHLDFHAICSPVLHCIPPFSHKACCTIYLQSICIIVLNLSKDFAIGCNTAIQNARLSWRTLSTYVSAHTCFILCGMPMSIVLVQDNTVVHSKFPIEILMSAEDRFCASKKGGIGGGGHSSQCRPGLCYTQPRQLPCARHPVLSISLLFDTNGCI